MSSFPPSQSLSLTWASLSASASSQKLPGTTDARTKSPPFFMVLTTWARYTSSLFSKPDGWCHQGSVRGLGEVNDE